MTQPQRGPVRAEVDDLRNIVDRLDLLMGSSGGATVDHDRGEALSERLQAVFDDLGTRVSALEGGLEELRTLVNHLMTIATWQAKVTATLVEDEVDETVDSEGEEIDVPDSHPPADGAADAEVGAFAAEQYPERTEPGRGRVLPSYGGQRQEVGVPPQPTLDEDIDEILGTNRDQSGEQVPPPDFGI